MGRLRPCRECKHDVSKSASACPNCGARNPTKEGGIGIVGILAVVVVGWLAFNYVGPAINAPTGAQPKQTQSDAPTASRPAAPPPRCQLSDFEIIGFNTGAHNPCSASPCPVYRLTGEIVNNCSRPAGAEVRIAGYSRAGTVIQTNSGWPASTSNSAPGARFPFDLGPLFDYSPEMVEFTIEVVNVRIWRDR